MNISRCAPLLGLFALLCGSAIAQVPSGAESSPIRSWFIAPTRVVWQSEAGVKDAANLLQPKPGQAVLKEAQPPCVLTATEGKPAGILLDFGTELHGMVELFTPMTKGKEPRMVRVRFGESVSEAMAELGERDAQNDHAVRDQTVLLPWLGKKTVGPSGFRFVRIDALDPKTPVSLSQVRAVLQMRDVSRIGAFRCSDERLNKIWETGAYTVQLNMQEYLWDGIKRDRLVWIGDMHPEVSTINAVFGLNEVVPKSLDLTRDVTPVTQWMNGISSYSMWWVLIQEEMWMHHGDRAYLEAQKFYLAPLMQKLAGLVGPDGREGIDGTRFLDWPSSQNKQGVTAGLQALLVMTLESGARLLTTLGDNDTAQLCNEGAARGRKVVPEVNGSKSGAALLSLASMMDAKKTADEVLKVGGPKGVSTFYGFYVLQALARSGDIDTALDFISQYWGAMLDFGATTFWEDFDLAWTKDAARIDELVLPGKKDLHGDFGAYCYLGLRHSLCHGWASGPTAWLSQQVLGVRPLEPGCKRVRIAPRLGRLAWAEGAYPTPLGPIKVRHEWQPDGSIKSEIHAPAGVIIERDATALRVNRLRTEYLANPEGIEAAQPRLQWQLESPQRGQRQTAYRILVASSPAALARDEGDLWDSGKVDGEATTQVAYAGKPLGSGRACFWKVQAWDKDGVASPWSEPAKWSMGLLKPEDWKAQWISFKDESPLHAERQKLHLPPARHYRKDFAAKNEVKRATLFFSALGIAELSLNGRKVGDAYFENGWSDYAERAYYRTHDVTSLIQQSDNRLGAIVTDGWYAGYVGYGMLVGYGPNKTGRNIYGKTPALLAQLEIEYADGSRETIGTDTTWRTTGDGPIREADLLMGESFDARQTDERAWQWEPAIRAEDNGSTKAKFFESGTEREIDLGFHQPPKLAAYTAPSIRVVEELPSQRITEPKPGTYIFDLGQNIAGVIRLKVKGAAGTVVQIRHGEMLHKDGRLMTENLRKARATDSYTLRGDADSETWQPRFTYHGFQFVELTGLAEKPSLDAVTGLVLSNNTPPAGEFACSDPVMTQFWKNTVRTQRANFIEIPTDCPQRDERLGWMGDAQIYVRTASYNADVAAFFTKWLDDLEEAQRESGAYPDYAPYPFAHGKPGATHGTAWTDAGVICPWTIWQVYGDTRVLERHWASMTKFMEWRSKSDPDLKGVSLGNTWGDWLNVNENTPIEYVDLCYHFTSTRLMAQMAEALGKKEAAADYTARTNKLAGNFRSQFVKPDGALSIETQSAAVLAFSSGIIAPTARAEDAAWLSSVVENLVARITRNDTRMATGFLGTKELLPVLTATGHHDLAVRLFQSRRFPSWGYEVEQGATSVWERWDSFTKENGFDGATGKNNAAMNSFSHYAFGAVMQWAFQTLAGIDTDGPGYRRILIRPNPPAPATTGEPKPIDWVKARYDSIQGPIASEWRTNGADFELHTTIPANTTATIFLPASDAVSVTERGKPLGDAPGVKLLRSEPGRVVLAVESGEYHFRSSR